MLKYILMLVFVACGSAPAMGPTVVGEKDNKSEAGVYKCRHSVLFKAMANPRGYDKRRFRSKTLKIVTTLRLKDVDTKAGLATIWGTKNRVMISPKLSVLIDEGKLQVSRQTEFECLVKKAKGGGYFLILHDVFDE